MTPTERVADITEKLQAVHASVGPNEALDALHQSLKEGLDEHHGLLGIDEDGLAHVEQRGFAARGGNPKDASADE